MGKSKILLVGGGGHCRSVLDCLLRTGTYEEIGIIDQNKNEDPGLMGIPILGTDEDLPALFSKGWTNAGVTLGSVGCPNKRRLLFRRLTEIGFTLPTILDSSCVIGREVLLGEGVFVGKGTIINCGARVGSGAIVNTGAIIEHDCHIEDFVHISPGARLCGEVCIRENTHIGAGAVVRQQIEVGRDSLIGIGSVVVQNIPDRVEAYGNPCKVVKML